MIPRLRQAAQGCLIPKQWSDRRLGYGLNGVVVYRNLNPMTNLHQPATPRGHASRLGTQRRVYDRLYLLWTIRGFTTAPRCHFPQASCFLGSSFRPSCRSTAPKTEGPDISPALQYPRSKSNVPGMPVASTTGRSVLRDSSSQNFTSEALSSRSVPEGLSSERGASGRAPLSPARCSFGPFFATVSA